MGQAYIDLLIRMIQLTDFSSPAQISERILFSQTMTRVQESKFKRKSQAPSLPRSRALLNSPAPHIPLGQPSISPVSPFATSQLNPNKSLGALRILIISTRALNVIIIIIIIIRSVVTAVAVGAFIGVGFAR